MLENLVNLKNNTMELNELKCYLTENNPEEKIKIYKKIEQKFLDTDIKQQLGFLNLLNYYKIKIYKDLKGLFILKNVTSKKEIDQIIAYLDEYESIDELFVFDMYKRIYTNEQKKKM